jgi:hypothetical protein
LNGRAPGEYVQVEGCRQPATRAVRSVKSAVRWGLPLPVMIMVCGSRNDTVVTTSRWPRMVVDLTGQHKNPTLLVEGPEITVRSIGTRRVTGGPR